MINKFWTDRQMEGHDKKKVLRGGATVSLKSKVGILLPLENQDGVHLKQKEILYGKKGSVQYIYQQVSVGNDLRGYLRHAHKPRCKRKGNNSRRGIIPDRVFIDHRPAIADEKARIGDWEGDTIEGCGKKGYVATFVDRKTKFLVANKINHKTSSELVKGAIRAFKEVPRTHLKTITLDNGREFSRHKALSMSLQADVYFAHPYHSWERGLNEHTNGLLRQYIPKKMNLLNLGQKELDNFVWKLNNRPRKILGYRTPHEVFFNLPLALQI